MNLGLDLISKYIGGSLSGPSKNLINSVSTDTRTLKEGALFIALRGGNFDGHVFLAEAEKKGAKGAIVEKGVAIESGVSLPLIWVSDTLRALQDFAHHYRMLLPYPILAITGTNGKTTTKDLIFSIASVAGKYEVTRGNLNNHIGVPLTLLGFSSDAAGGILEMGMNHLGEIQRLTEIALPTGGLITNIGEGHLEFLKSKDGVFKAKTELWETMREGSSVIINLDDPFLSSWKSHRDYDRITFSMKEKRADVYLENPHWEGGSWNFNLTFNRTLGGEEPRRLRIEHFPVIGPHNLLNAAAASAACRYFFGIGDEEIKRGLSHPQITSGRNEIQSFIDPSGFKVKVVFDAYNSNPASVRALHLSLKNCLQKTEHEIQCLVFGDMLELGENSEKLHHEMGELLGDLNLNAYFSIGTESRHFQNALHARILDTAISNHFESSDELVESLTQVIMEAKNGGSTQSALVVFKGSRGMRLERILEELQRRLTLRKEAS